MLTELHIENIAVIERSDIDFTEGLNVLSGETGAGKSIIIDSINAVLGSRTSRELIRHGADSARVTAVFETERHFKWLEDNEIDQPEDGQIILQRRLTRDGKSGCRICGVPVTAAQLKEFAACLVDIHGQNDGMRLLDEKSHLSFLDGYAEPAELKDDFLSSYRELLKTNKEIKRLAIDNEEKERRSAILKQRISELEALDLKPGEYDELTARRDILRNSEKLTEALSQADTLLNGGDENAISNARGASVFIKRVSEMNHGLDAAAASLDDACFQLTNAAEIIEDFLRELDFSDEEYDELERRISTCERLARKYSTDTSELPQKLTEYQNQLSELDYSADKTELLRKELAEQIEICREKAKRLSQFRKEAAVRLQERVTNELKDLNMPSVRFVVEFCPIQTKAGFNSTGCDEIRFLMSANAGEEPGRINKIASGGELSRIMLALKNVFAEKDTVDTMIFDEIDTGVSGISAQRVAEKLWSVSKGKQVMCVSHLPQIAAMADSQYLVSKSESNGRTYTSVAHLDTDGRIAEISRMYGGDNISQKTMAAAAEQLQAAEAFKTEKH